MRFDKKRNEWCKIFVKDAFTFLSNNTLSRDKLTYVEGKYKTIHYGDILTKYESVKNVNDNDVPFIIDKIKCNNDILKPGDIVIADTAEDYTVGKTIEIADSSSIPAYSGLHTIALRPNIKFAEGFIAYYFNSKAFKKRIYPLIQGIKVYSISKTNLSNCMIKYPSYDVQLKITILLKNIDNKISTQKKIIRVLETQKKVISQKIYDNINVKTKLGNLITYEKKTNHKSEDGLNDGIYPFYTNEENTTKYFNSYDFDGIYMLANTGGKANFKLVDGKFAVMSDTLVIKFKQRKLAKFYIDFFINNKVFINQNYFAGSGLKHLNKKAFLNFEIPFVENNVEHISNLFTLLNKKIIIAKKTLSLYEKQKQYLLNHMFI